MLLLQLVNDVINFSYTRKKNGQVGKIKKEKKKKK